MDSHPERPTFTVFTPTFNRAHTLRRVYESLVAQTLRDFEWLIVDDGSTDGTEDLVRGWQEAGRIAIRFVRQEGAGKHVAFNRGVREAAGALFLTLDSDDACVPQALETFRARWEGIPEATRHEFSAVTALVCDQDGQVVGDPFPSDPTDSDSLEQYFILRVKGEKWGFQRTDVLRAFPFPEPAGVRFVSEAIVWFAIARRYKTRYINETLRIYHQDVGQENLSTLTRTTAMGRLLFHEAVLEQYMDYFPRAPDLVLKSAINFVRYSAMTGAGPLTQLRRIRTAKGRLAVLVALPAGYLLAVRDRRASGG